MAWRTPCARPTVIWRMRRGWRAPRAATAVAYRWPQIASPLAVAWYVTYVLCRWDVETLVLIVPPGGETAALRIFNLLHYGHTAQVNALCLLLLFLALLPWILWQTGRGVHTCSAGCLNSFRPGRFSPPPLTVGAIIRERIQLQRREGRRDKRSCHLCVLRVSAVCHELALDWCSAALEEGLLGWNDGRWGRLGAGGLLAAGFQRGEA